jgi:class 3 adenylate cyclase
MTRPRIEDRMRYVFFDVVGFTRISPVDDQMDVIQAFNHVVRNVIRAVVRDEGLVRYLPTGDGMCIALKPGGAVDLHLKLAEALLLLAHCDATLRDVQLTVGVGEGADFSFADINGQENFAGPAINATARAMGGAQPNEILITEAVYESLKYYSSYYGKLVPVIREVKGVSWKFYRKSE